ncbi:hypothetical protein ACLOJK_021881 [Asimina triloba]
MAIVVLGRINRAYLRPKPMPKDRTKIFRQTTEAVLVSVMSIEVYGAKHTTGVWCHPFLRRL